MPGPQKWDLRLIEKGLVDPDGIVWVGNDLSAETLVNAYRDGVFPWPHDEFPVLWFHPDPRAVLFFRDLHIPASLMKKSKKTRFEFSINRAFSDVIRACADTKRPGQAGTWITSNMISAYETLHKKKYANSVETWLDGRLVGGIYGVSVDGTFSAESMFFCEPDASKLALLHLIQHLKKSGLEWIDIQMMTPHMKRFGATEISRNQFLDLLRKTHKRGLVLF